MHPVAAEAPLLARYRRPLTFGGVLDETFQIFRRIWLACAFVLAIAYVPVIGALALLGGTSALITFFGASAPSFGSAVGSAQPDGSGVATGAIVGIVFLLTLTAAGGAIIVLSDGVMRGQRVGVGQSVAWGIRRLPSMIGATLLYLVAELVLLMLAIPLLIVSLCGLVPLVALIVWFASPKSRAPWLKWLIVLSTPFGLPTYLGTRWAFWLPPCVLERSGPAAALQRSSALVRGYWFRTLGVLLVVSLIVVILQEAPGTIVAVIQVIVAQRGPDSNNSLADALVAVRLVVSLASGVIFGGATYIACTVLYHDLRNRNEGADLAEQVSAVEQAAQSAF